jgi:Trypsin-co-occurring domain 1
MMKARRKKIDALSEPGDEVEVKFGVKLSGQVGAVVTAGAEATYEVTLKWSKK